MFMPLRNSGPSVRTGARTFFVTAKTAEGKALLQSERMATLFIEVLRSYVPAGGFKVHEFVVMRNFVHLLITVEGEMTATTALRSIRGRFAYRAKEQFGLRGWIWQKDFSEVRVNGRQNFLKYKSLIEEAPVKEGLARSAEEYPYCSLYLRRQKAAQAAGNS